MRPASEVLPGPWKTVSDVCCDWQLTNLALLHLLISQVHGIAAHSPVKFTCWCFQMSWPSQNAWRDTDVPPGVRLNTAQPREIPSLDQKTPLCNMQTKELPETCPQGVEMAQPEWSLELTQSTRVGLQVLSRTEPEEVVPGCPEPVYTADAIYWLNHYRAMASGKSRQRSRCTPYLLAVGKLTGLETVRELIVGNKQPKNKVCMCRDPS